MGGRGAAARGFVPGGAAEGALRRRGARRGGGGGERGAGAALGWEEGEGEKKKIGEKGAVPSRAPPGWGGCCPPLPPGACLLAAGGCWAGAGVRARGPRPSARGFKGCWGQRWRGAAAGRAGRDGGRSRGGAAGVVKPAPGALSAQRSSARACGALLKSC